MAIKVNDISTVNQVPEAAKTVEGDGSFKFTLASAITDADLQAKVDELAGELVADEKDHISILDRIGEIKGLLLDILT